MTEFKIKGVGLDTTELSYVSTYNKEFMHISSRSGNAYLFNNLPEDTKVICTIESGKNIRNIVQGILYEIGRSKIEVLLLPANSDPKNYRDDLVSLLDSGLIDGVGISMPDTLEHLKEATENLKSIVIPKYVSLEICPIHFQKEIIDWAREEDFKIFGFNPFGGYINGPRVISSFTIPYLLSFSAKYSDIVFLSSRDVVSSIDNENYLKDLIGRKSDTSIFDLDVSIDLTIEGLEKMIYPGIKISENCEVPYDNPDSIFNYSDLVLKFSEFSISPEQENTKIPEEEKICKEIFEHTLMIYDNVPGENIMDSLSVVRPNLVKALREKFTGWTITTVFLSHTASIIRVSKELIEKKIFKKDKKHLIYYCFLLTGEKDKLVFYNIPSENSFI